MIPRFTLRSAWFFDVFVVDSPSGYNLGEINDIVQST